MKLAIAATWMHPGCVQSERASSLIMQLYTKLCISEFLAILAGALPSPDN
jgi:hypothetical protein